MQHTISSLAMTSASASTQCTYAQTNDKLNWPGRLIVITTRICRAGF